MLFITVGTGWGRGEEGKESLAHAIRECIKHWKPEKVLFFCTEKSSKQIGYIERQFEEKGEKIQDYEPEECRIKDGDDTANILKTMDKKVEEFEGWERIVNYTSGTKSMSAAIVIIGILNHLEISNIRGTRGEGGIVIKGTEQIMGENLYYVYDKLLLEKGKNQINRFDFQEAVETLKKIVDPEMVSEKESLTALANFYKNWDILRHEEAMGELNNIKSSDIKRRMGKNIEFLRWLIERKKRYEDTKNPEDYAEKMSYFIVDILSNAERRINEGKFDDAAARCYRVVEAIAQLLLSKHGLVDDDGISTQNFKSKFPDIFSVVSENMGFAEKEKRIRIGLEKKYMLLKAMNKDNKNTNIQKIDVSNEMRNLLKMRNLSILAHGCESIDKKSGKEFLHLSEKMAEDVIKNYKKLREMSRFLEI